MDFLKEIGKLVCRLASTPIDLNHKLREAEENAAVDRNVLTFSRKTRLSLSHKTEHCICCKCD